MKQNMYCRECEKKLDGPHLLVVDTLDPQRVRFCSYVCIRKWAKKREALWPM